MNRQYGALRGLAIVLVVLNHSIHFGLMISPVGGFWFRFLAFFQSFGLFAVPTFLFISGAFLSFAADGLSAKFLWASFERILCPYLIWSLVFSLLATLSGDVHYSVSGYLKNILVGYPYHFVPLLFFCYLTAPVLVWLVKRDQWVWCWLVIAAYQILLLCLRYPSIFGLPFALPGWVNLLKPPVLFQTMADWAIYFPTGLILGLNNSTLRPRLLKLKWISLAAVVILYLLSGLTSVGVLSARWARFVAPLPVVLLLPLIERKRIPLLNFFERVGKQSYGVYLVHFIVIHLMVLFGTRVIPKFQSWPVVVPTVFIGALMVSLTLAEELKKRGSTVKAHRYIFG